jgi:O-antigen ligase
MTLPPSFGHAQPGSSLMLPLPQVTPRRQSVLLNWWLVPIVLIGMMVVIADGLTRPLVLEEEKVNGEALTYEPYHAALVFAFFMLPLMVAYGSTARLSRKETLFLWFLLCTATYAKDFSYIRLPGVGIYVTDVVLLTLTLSLSSRLRAGLRSLGGLPATALVGFFVCGLLAAGRGLFSGQDKILVLRDSALVVYSLFLPLGFLLVSSWESVKRIYVFVVLGAVLCTLNAFVWFLMQPGQRRYVAYGPYVLISLLGTIILTNNRLIRPALGWSLVGLLGLGVLLTNARTIYVSLAVALLIMILVGPTARLRINARSLRSAALLSVTLVGLFWTVSRTRAGAELVELTETELVSGTLNYADDPNAGFRFLAWLEALHRFSEHPLTGEGYGVPFIFDLDQSDVRPHNTYLTVLYKTGLIGIAPLILLLVSFHGRGWKRLRSASGQPDALLFYVLLMGQVVMSIFGLLNLLLESPFLASVFWLILGIGFRMMYMLASSQQAAPRLELPR